MYDKNRPIEIYGMYTNPERITQLIEYKNKLIKNMTIYEKHFYEILKEVELKKWGCIIPQKIFTNGKIAYIVDFYVYMHGLAFEIDGKQHEKNKHYDDRRTEFLNSYFSLKVVRIKNEDVFKEDIKGKIIKSMGMKKPSRKLFDGLSEKEINQLTIKACQDTKWIEECERKLGGMNGYNDLSNH